MGHEGNTKQLGPCLPVPSHLEPARFVGVEQVKASGSEQKWALIGPQLYARRCTRVVPALEEELVKKRDV